MERFRAFHAVATEGGFSAAAVKLHRTQPAISQAVRSLELELGERLFDRSGRGVRLTHAGQLLLEHVDSALAQLAAGCARVESLKELAEGALTLSVSDTLAIHRLPEMLGVYRTRHPGVELRLLDRSSNGALADVRAGDAELGIITRKPQEARLVAEPLSQFEDVAICAPGDALAGMKSVRLSRLCQSPLLWLDKSSELRRDLEARLRAEEEKPKATMEFGSVEVIKRMVAIGLGVSVAPRMAVEEELARGTLVALPLVPRTPPRRLWAVYRKRPEPSAAARAMLGLLREHLPAEHTL